MSEVLLYNGDCIQAMGGIADHSINLILTDPPYNLGNFMISRDTNLKKMRDNFFGAAGWDNLEYDEWIKAIDGFFEQAARVMKKGGSMIVFMAAIKVETTISLAEKHGFYYKTTGTWHKLNPMPRNMNLHFAKRIVWRCISRLDYGKKYCSDSPTIMEDKLQEAIVRAVNKFNKQDNATYKALMRATISEALGLNGDPEEVDMLERKVEALNNKMLALVNESVSSGDGIEAHESEFMTLSQETELLKQRIAAIQESTAKDNGEQSRLEQIQAIISERESKCMEYDDSIVRQMVECIKVYPGGKLEIIFGGGYLVEESV